MHYATYFTLLDAPAGVLASGTYSPINNDMTRLFLFYIYSVPYTYLRKAPITVKTTQRRPMQCDTPQETERI